VLAAEIHLGRIDIEHVAALAEDQAGVIERLDGDVAGRGGERIRRRRGGQRAGGRGENGDGGKSEDDGATVEHDPSQGSRLHDS
jgi:hypothetical protein